MWEYSQILNKNISPYFHGTLLLSDRLLRWKEPILASYPFLGLLLIREAQGCTHPIREAKTPSSEWPGRHKSNAEPKHIKRDVLEPRMPSVWSSARLGLQRRQGYQASFNVSWWKWTQLVRNIWNRNFGSKLRLNVGFTERIELVVNWNETTTYVLRFCVGFNLDPLYLFWKQLGSLANLASCPRTLIH